MGVMSRATKEEPPVIYAEAAYFDGYHVQHIADYYERQRLARKKERK